NSSRARACRETKQNRAMHVFNGGGEDATRCARAGQFPSVLPPARRKVSAELDTTRDLIKNVSKHYVPRSMKNFLQILPIALCGLAGTAFADDFKSMVITSGMLADLPPIHGDQFMVIRNFTQDDGSPRGVVTVTKPPNGATSEQIQALALAQV